MIYDTALSTPTYWPDGNSVVCTIKTKYSVNKKNHFDSIRKLKDNNGREK